MQQHNGSHQVNAVDAPAGGRLRNLSIGTKLALSAFAAVLVAMAALTWFVVDFTSAALNRKALEDLQQQSIEVSRLLHATDANLRGTVDILGRTLTQAYSGEFKLDAGRTVDVAGVRTPVLRLNGHRVNGDLAPVDAFTAMTGGVATVFARSGDDFVRVATSLKNDHGERVLGTTLAKDHPGRAAMLAGQPFTGKATLFGREYMTQYLPVRDAGGNVVGALFVGLDFSARLASIKAAIKEIKVGDTGYVYALDANPGANFGLLTVHPFKEGQNIAAAKDSSGREFIRQILETKNGVIEYPWINAEKGETAPREKIVAFNHFKEWNWIVATGSYKAEFTRDARALSFWMIGGATVVLLVIGALVYLLSRRLVASPLSRVIRLFDEIKAGNYSSSIEVRSRDEVGNLLAALKTMQEKLGADIEQARRAANETLRIKNALDRASTNVMIADNDGRIII